MYAVLNVKFVCCKKFNHQINHFLQLHLLADKVVVVLLLLLEILNTIIREIVSLIAPESRSAAILTVVLFSIS